MITAQTPREKRAAVNRILSERQGGFDAAYKAAYGHKAASQWENDKKYTLNSMGDYVSTEDLQKFGWNNVNPDIMKDLNNTLIKYDITTLARIRHFLAQSARSQERANGPQNSATATRMSILKAYTEGEIGQTLAISKKETDISTGVAACLQSFLKHLVIISIRHYRSINSNFMVIEMTSVMDTA